MTEAQASSFDRISPTALMTAYARQFTDIPYSKELAQLIDAQTVVAPLPDETLQKAIQIEGAVRVESRYKPIDQVIFRLSPVQIIELASGVLPRGITISQNPNVTFIESDLPKMITRKQQLVKQLVGERPNLRFIAIDATAQPSQFPLHADYLDPRKPVIILCEGLLGYLTFDQKRIVFANVREMLQIYGGAWITSDLDTLDNLNQMGNIFQQLVQVAQSMTGSSLKDNTFTSFEHVEQFALEQGFRVERHDMLEILEQLTCLQPLEIPPNVAESILASSSVCVLTLHHEETVVG